MGKWKADNNIKDREYLHPTEILRLTEALGIKPYLQKDKCDKYREPYSQNIQGFSSGILNIVKQNSYHFYKTQLCPLPLSMMISSILRY